MKIKITEEQKRVKRFIWLLSISLAFALTIMITGAIKEEQKQKLQTHLAGEVLRLHVLANSDSEKDQDLKLKVRDEIVKLISHEMPEKNTVEETISWVKLHRDEIEEKSKNVVEKEGYNYPVNAAVVTCWFPKKTYGDLTFPEGNYKALRIEIGRAEGKNWWCVLYPELCFLDTTNAVVPKEGKEKLKDVLTENEYAEITATTDFKISWYLSSFFSRKETD